MSDHAKATRRRKKRGRPAGLKRDRKVLFSVLLERNQRDKIGEMALENGQPMAVVLRSLIEVGLEHRPQKKGQASKH